MARMRKAGRPWRDPAALAMAESAMVAGGGAVFTLDPPEIFRRPAPLEVELGAGRGDFIVQRAAAFPEHNLLAVELPASVCRLLALRVARSALGNLKVLRADARAVVNLLMPPDSVTVLHVYFPDPWPKERHAKHRLFSPCFVANLARVLRRDGMLCVATDVEAYAERIFAMLAEANFSRAAQHAPGGMLSNFGRKYRAAGRAIFAATFTPPPRRPAQ